MSSKDIQSLQLKVFDMYDGAKKYHDSFKDESGKTVIKEVRTAFGRYKRYAGRASDMIKFGVRSVISDILIDKAIMIDDFINDMLPGEAEYYFEDLEELSDDKKKY